MSIRGISYFALVLFLAFSPISNAQVFFHDEGELFVDEEIKKRTIGIEIEFGGLTKEAVTQILQDVFQAKVERVDALEIEFSSAFGKILIKNEGRAWRYEGNELQFNKQLVQDSVASPLEIVFPPLKFEHMAAVHEVAQRLKAAGATGTTNLNAVSLQVNLQMEEINLRPEAVEDLLNLMRVYFNPEHRKQAKAILEVPQIRSEFILGPSNGFLKRLNTEGYNPTAQELFEDYFYRQSLELLGNRQAWTLPIQEVREVLLSKGEGAIVPRVAKMNALRISSLLLKAFPEDPLTKLITASRWAKAAPIVEFREFNNNFDVMAAVKWSLGVTRAAQLHKNYNHDQLISEITGIAVADVARLRKELQRLPLIRYALQDPSRRPLTEEDRQWLKKMNPGASIIQLDPNRPGAKPLKLRGESVVWQRRHIHRTTLLGTYNPGLENHLIQQVLENKIFEAKIYEKYAPGAMPESIVLADILGRSKANAKTLADTLKKRFPNGWVLKGAWDLGSEKEIITDKTDLAKAMEAYENGFEAHRASILKKYGGGDPEEIAYHMKRHKGFKGWVIKSLLSNPRLTMVQARENLHSEFRVEVLGGRVLGDGSTIERYGYLRSQGKDVGVEFTKAELNDLIRQAEDFAQRLIDRLPNELRVLPYGLDVARTQDGRWILIESNAGGNSSFLEEMKASSQALLKYLKNYPYSVKALVGLLSEAEQMAWIRKHLEGFKMPTSVYYPGMKFGSEDIQDPEYKPISCSNVLK